MADARARCTCTTAGATAAGESTGAAGAAAETRKQQRNERERKQRASKAIAAGRQPGVAGRPRAALPSVVMAAVAEELDAARVAVGSAADERAAGWLEHIKAWPQSPSQDGTTPLLATTSLPLTDAYVMRLRSHFDALDALQPLHRPRKPPAPDGCGSDVVREQRICCHTEAVQRWEDNYLRPWKVRSQAQPSIPPGAKLAMRCQAVTQRRLQLVVEDTIIAKLHRTEGPKWAKIAQALPGRSVASVRNRFLRMQKTAASSKAVCELCHLPPEYGCGCKGLLDRVRSCVHEE